VIETMFLSIIRLSVELMIRSDVDPEIRRRSDPYHRALYEAIAARDSDAAREAITAHLSIASVTYGPDYEEQLDLVVLPGVASLGYSDVENLVRDLALH
jgi:DNA-binding FadR family transcriptional regulator